MQSPQSFSWPVPFLSEKLSKMYWVPDPWDVLPWTLGTAAGTKSPTPPGLHWPWLPGPLMRHLVDQIRRRKSGLEERAIRMMDVKTVPVFSRDWGHGLCPSMHRPRRRSGYTSETLPARGRHTDLCEKKSDSLAKGGQYRCVASLGIH